MGLLSSLLCQAQLRQVVLISNDNTFEVNVPMTAEIRSIAQMVFVLGPAGKVSGAQLQHRVAASHLMSLPHECGDTAVQLLH